MLLMARWTQHPSHSSGNLPYPVWELEGAACPGIPLWDTKGWIQLTRFDQLNSFTSQRTVAFAGLYGECQLVTESSPAGISKCKGDAPANANPKISWIMKESTSIRTSRESHKNLAPYNHQLQKTKNGSRSIKSPAHTHWTSR